jgi:uncharacterized membrane protein
MVAMIEILSHLFAAVCGQNPGHTWAPGGMLLPCCQRCTGLYVGAGVAGLLHLWLRPRLSGRFLEIHGAFLLFMAPFGFHWVADGPALRTVTGVLFGFGVVTFLWLALESRAGVPPALGYAGLKLLRSAFGWGGGKDTSGAGGTPALLWGQSGVLGYFLVLAATLVILPLTASLGGALAAHVLCVLITWGMLCFAALVVANIGLGLLATSRWCLRSSRITHRASRTRSPA